MKSSHRIFLNLLVFLSLILISTNFGPTTTNPFWINVGKLCSFVELLIFLLTSHKNWLVTRAVYAGTIAIMLAALYLFNWELIRWLLVSVLAFGVFSPVILYLRNLLLSFIRNDSSPFSGMNNFQWFNAQFGRILNDLNFLR